MAESFSEFVSRHAQKYAGLSRSDKRSRYEDYLANFDLNDAADLARSAGRSVSKRVNSGLRQAGGGRQRPRTRADPPMGGRRSERGERRTDLQHQNPTSLYESDDAAKAVLQNYFHSLMDPWAKGVPARQPTMAEYPSLSDFTKVQKVIKTDAQGNFLVFISDDIDRFIADSWTPRGDALVPTISNTGGSNPRFAIRLPISPGDVANPASLSMWEEAPDYETLKKTFSSFRTVSGGVSLKYIAELVQAKGQVVAGLWHPNENLPQQADITDSGLVNGVTFAELVDRESAQVFSPIDGVTLLWRPFGDDVTEFRPTTLAESSPFSAMPGSEALTCSARADSYAMRTLTALAQVGAFADNPEVFSGAKFARSLDGELSSSSPCLYIAGKGLQPNTEVFTMETVWNWEMIADERTLNFTSPFSPDVQSKVSVGLGPSVKALASAPASAAGYRADGPEPVNTIASQVNEGNNSTFNDVLSGIGTAIEVGTTLASFLL